MAPRSKSGLVSPAPHFAMTLRLSRQLCQAGLPTWRGERLGVLSWIGPGSLRVTFSQGFKLLMTKLLPPSQSQQILPTAPRVPVAGCVPAD